MLRGMRTYGDVHALSSFRTVGMGSISSEEDALVQSIVRSNALANLVDGEPVDVAKFEGVRVENLLSSLDANILGLLIAVCTSLELNVETDETSFSRNDHD
jgi:hypothetical protein